MNPRKIVNSNKHQIPNYFVDPKHKHKTWKGLKEHIQKIKYKKLKYELQMLAKYWVYLLDKIKVKVGLLPSKKYFICFNESLLKMMKNEIWSVITI